MKTLLIVIAILVGLFLLRIIVPVAIKLFVLLFLRKLMRPGLEEIGRDAQARQPDTIHLSPQSAATWKDPAGVERMRAPLVAKGFQDVGTFTVAEIPGIQLQLLMLVSDSVYASICDHPKVGVWLDLFSSFQDGTSITFSTNRNRGVEQPPGKTKVYAPGVAPDALLQRLLAERRKKPLMTFDAQGLVKRFEDSYAEEIAWRKKRGPSAKEVAKVMASRSSGS
jgi:hypothetical protein